MHRRNMPRYENIEIIVWRILFYEIKIHLINSKKTSIIYFVFPVPCFKYENGTGKGDGTTKGTCSDEELRGIICYSDGKCGKCSKNGTAVDGNEKSGGYCPSGLSCFSTGCGMITKY